MRVVVAYGMGLDDAQIAAYAAEMNLDPQDEAAVARSVKNALTQWGIKTVHQRIVCGARKISGGEHGDIKWQRIIESSRGC